MTVVKRCDWEGCDFESDKEPNENKLVEIISIGESEGADLCPNHLSELNKMLDVEIGGNR